MAVPKSGCSRIRPSGTPVSTPALHRSPKESRSERTSVKKRASTMIIINLASSDTWKNCPSTGSQRLAPNRVCPSASTATSASSADEVENGRFVQHRVVIEPREQQHADHAHADPGDLLPLHAGQMAGVRGRPDFEHAQAADGKRDGQQPPVVVANSGALFHAVSPLASAPAGSGFCDYRERGCARPSVRWT